VKLLGVINLQRTSNVFARVEPEIKDQAERILNQLGIPMSNAIGLFLRQIIMQRGIPFDMKLPDRMPPVIGVMSVAELNAELQKGYDDNCEGRLHDLDDVVAEMHKDYNA